MNDIPKIIHYCWFGGSRKPKLVKECIKSWKKHLPDYKIVEWNETNSDLSHPFTKKAYLEKKWAFVSDYIRLKVLYNNGGIYLDTDMFVLKSFNSFLKLDCFFGTEEQEENILGSAIIGCVKHCSFLKECLNYYNSIELQHAIQWNSFVNTHIITRIFRRAFNYKGSFGEKLVFDRTIAFPINYFYPLPFNSKADISRFRDYIKTDSFAVHLWSGSWKGYNEFKLLRNRNYLLAFKTIYNQKSFKNINYKYIRKMLSAFKESLRF